MGAPIDNNLRNIYDDPNVNISGNPLAAPRKAFDINATDKAFKAKEDSKRDKNDKKKDKNGKDIEEEEDKPLPRPMGL